MKSLPVNKKNTLILMALTIILVMFITVPAIAENQQVYNGSGNNVAIGHNVYYDEMVNGDAVAIGGSTAVNNGANGEVVAIGGNATAKGTINGNVVAIGGNVKINGNVNGDAVAIGGKVILIGNSIVNGQVVASEIVKDDTALIRGEIVSTNIPQIRIPFINGGSLLGFQLFLLPFKIVGLLLTFAIISLIIALYPDGVETIAQSVEKDTWRDLRIGFIAFILLFPLFITILGIPLVIFIYIAAKFLGYAGVTLFIGRKFINTINRNTDSTYLQVLVGIILIALIKFVPIFGFLVGIVLFWLSLGAIIDTKFGTGRPWFNRA